MIFILEHLWRHTWFGQCKYLEKETESNLAEQLKNQSSSGDEAGQLENSQPPGKRGRKREKTKRQRERREGNVKLVALGKGGQFKLPCLRNCPASLGAVWNPVSELKDLSSGGVSLVRSGHWSTSQKALQYKWAQTDSNDCTGIHCSS